MSKMRAFGYLRVSSKGQVDGDGFDRQEQAIRQYCESRNMELAGLYREEGVSGTTEEGDRPAFQEMVAAILRNGVRTVIIEGMDRLAREYRIQEQLVVFLASKNITLVCARTEEDVTAAVMGDPMKKAMVQMQGVFAELEKSLLVKKLRVARERIKAETGKCGGRKATIEVMPDFIERVRKLRLKPRQGKRKTWAEIAEVLNAEGLRTVSGKEWTGYSLQSVWARHGRRRKVAV